VEVIPLAPVGSVFVFFCIHSDRNNFFCRPVPPLPLSLQGKTALYGYEVTEELVKNCPDYLALKCDNYSGDARLRAFVEVAKRLGLDSLLMDIEPGEEWREVSSDPQASTAHIACFACTRYGISYCVKEDVLRKLEQDLKTDVRAKWIVI